MSRDLTDRALVVEMKSIFLDPPTQSAIEVQFEERTENIVTTNTIIQ